MPIIFLDASHLNEAGPSHSPIVIDLDEDDSPDQSRDFNGSVVPDEDVPDVIVPDNLTRPLVVVPENVEPDIVPDVVGQEVAVPENIVPDIVGMEDHAPEFVSGPDATKKIVGPEIVPDIVGAGPDVVLETATPASGVGPEIVVPSVSSPSANPSMPPPVVPPTLPSSIPAIQLLPPTPNASQEEVSGPLTLLAVPDTTQMPSDNAARTRSRSRSHSPIPDSSQMRRSPRLSPAPHTKRPASDAVDEPAPKRPKGK
jgi:hypothetical protein